MLQVRNRKPKTLGVVDVCVLSMPFLRVLAFSRHFARLFVRFAASCDTAAAFDMA